MSNIDKHALRERYSAKPTPKCDICGAKMTIQRMSGSRVTYGCSGAICDETGCHYADGRSLADDHYEQSRVTVTDESDPDVLALLDELEAAEKRIAELEAREVTLPPVELVGYGDWPMFDANFVSEALRTAGINIAASGKGE
ncbi:ead/Ea22-like family protein [Enterobacter hormaechei]|nr:ead/Ea22-like family protein [Enterobacter hormaechei]